MLAAGLLRAGSRLFYWGRRDGGPSLSRLWAQLEQWLTLPRLHGDLDPARDSAQGTPPPWDFDPAGLWGELGESG